MEKLEVKEKFDIKALNQEIDDIVNRIIYLRKSINEIIKKINS